jgi:gliding motility-associated-like protein
VITTPSSPTCANSQALVANAVSSGVGTWSIVSAPSGAIVSFGNLNSNNTTLNGLTVAGNYVIKWTVANGNCPASESTITITREINPTIANAGINASTCANFFGLNANLATAGTGVWSVVNQPLGANASFGNASQNNTLVNGLTLAGVYQLRWTISNGTCAPSTSDVIVTRDASPTVSNAGVNQVTCATSFTLNANLPTVGSGVWSTVSVPSGAVVSFSNASVNNAAVNGLTVAGNYVFKWIVSNGTCNDSESTVTITKENAPTIANAGNNQILCANVATLNANLPTVGTGLWTVVSQPAGASAIFVNPTQNNTTINNMTVVGNYILRWTISNGGCAGSSADVTIIKEASPSLSNAGISTSTCANFYTTSANLPTVGEGMWSVVSAPAGAVVSFNNPMLNNATANGLTIAGNYIFKWSISNGTCANSESTITITKDGQPSTSFAGSNLTTCSSTTALNANLPTVGTGIWTVVSQPVGANASFTNPAQNNSNANNMTLAGVYVFRWTISSGACTASISDVTINREVSPTVANAGANQTICATTYTLAGNVPTVGTGMWSIVSVPTGAVVNFSNPAQNNASVTSMDVYGVYVFKWTISNGTCPSTESVVTITRETGPSPANAGMPQTVCATTATLVGNLPATGTGLWTVVSGGATITNPNNATTAVTNLALGANVFQWTISGTACPQTSATVTITRLDSPTVATVANNFSVCATTATLVGNVPTVGTGSWIVVTGSGTINTPNNPTTQVSNLSVGANIFKWTITNGACAPSEATITITRDAQPTPANAGPDQEVCAITATLSANNPSVGTGIWTVVSGSGAINSPNSYITGVTNLSVGDNIFKWTVTNGICAVTESVVNIKRYAVPTVADAGADLSSCGGNSIILNAVPVTVGLGTWSQLTGPTNAIFVNANSPNTQVNGLIGGIYTFRWRASNGVCAPTQDETTVTIVPNPNTSTSLAVRDLTICEAYQNTIDITVSNTEAGVTYELRNGTTVLSTILSNGGLITFTVPSPTTFPNVTTTYTYDVWAKPAILNNVSCPALQLVDKAVVKVDICNNPITNNLNRTTDFCTLLALNVITATENNNTPTSEYTATPIVNFVTVNGGVVNLNANGTFTYLPRTNFVGLDVVDYTICNRDTPARCNTGKVFITVLACTNTAPVVNDDTFNTDNCTVVKGNVLGNDSDANGDPLTATPSTPILTAAGGVFDLKADGSFEYTPKAGFVGRDSITYTACDNGSTNPVSIVKCDQATIYFNVTACEDVFVPGGFSPNDDLVNDRFVILGAERYDIHLRIFDRWGNLLYESEHYKNEWDGKANRGIGHNNGQGLPDGTYFYTIDFRSTKHKKRTGNLIIQR